LIEIRWLLRAFGAYFFGHGLARIGTDFFCVADGFSRLLKLNGGQAIERPVVQSETGWGSFKSNPANPC